jgi:hypothetical protein
MGDVADRSGLPAGQVLGPGSVELLVDPPLFRCLAQFLILHDRHDHRYHLATAVNYVAQVSPAGNSLMRLVVRTWTDSRSPRRDGSADQCVWLRRIILMA